MLSLLYWNKIIATSGRHPPWPKVLCFHQGLPQEYKLRALWEWVSGLPWVHRRGQIHYWGPDPDTLYRCADPAGLAGSGRWCQPGGRGWSQNWRNKKKGMIKQQKSRGAKSENTFKVVKEMSFLSIWLRQCLHFVVKGLGNIQNVSGGAMRNRKLRQLGEQQLRIWSWFWLDQRQTCAGC